MSTAQNAPFAVLLAEEHYRKRVRGLQADLASQGDDGLLILNPANLMWATGFFHIPNERPMGLYVPAMGDPILFVPLLERENAEKTWLADIRWYLEYPGETVAEAWMAQQMAGERIVLDECLHTVFEAVRAVKPQAKVQPSAVARRFVKTPEELALIKAAAGYADYGLTVARQAVAEGLRRGINELDVVQIVQSETTAKMRRELDDLVNFYRGAIMLTAHTGPRAALPHGQPGPVAIRPGDTLIVGIGARVGGYHAESGCTFIIGEPTTDQLRCLEATWACDEAAVAALRPGATCAEVNEAAWRVLRDRGYNDFIRHRIGHGLGIEGHEAPWLAPGDGTVIRENMAFSNEPGIYRPGVDGYRIIDSMIATPEGGRRLSRYLSEHGPDDRVIEPA